MTNMPNTAPQDRLSGRFDWTSPEGVQISLPRMGKISAKLLRDTRKLDAEDRMWTLLEGVADEATLAQIDALSGDELTTFTDGWSKTLGESGGSSI